MRGVNEQQVQEQARHEYDTSGRFPPPTVAVRMVLIDPHYCPVLHSTLNMYTSLHATLHMYTAHYTMIHVHCALCAH